MRDEAKWNRYTTPLSRLRGARRIARQQEDDAEASPADVENMHTMTLDRVYDRAIMKAYSARIEVHSLAAEAAHEGMTTSFQRALRFWERERDAADETLAAITAIRGHLMSVETRAALADTIQTV